MSTWFRNTGPSDVPGQAPEIEMDGVLPPVEGGAEFPGQVTGVPEHLVVKWVRRGMVLVGAMPEPTPELREHVHAVAHAEGQAVRALAFDAVKIASDARSEVLRKGKAADLVEAISATREQEARMAEAARALGAAQVASTASAWGVLLLAGVVGLAGAVVFLPTAQLLFSAAMTKVLGAGVTSNASIVLALALGLTPPLLAYNSAQARSSRTTFIVAGVLEFACLAGLAWGRWHLLSAVDATNLLASEVAALEEGARSRTLMMIAIETLGIVVAGVAGCELSAALTRRDTRASLEAQDAVERDQLARVSSQQFAVEAWLEADRKNQLARDLAAAAGEKEEALVFCLMWEGVLRQTQANWDMLHGTEAAGVG